MKAREGASKVARMGQMCDSFRSLERAKSLEQAKQLKDR
jgi:hypothetical protein